MSKLFVRYYKRFKASDKPKVNVIKYWIITECQENYPNSRETCFAVK